MNSKHAKSNGFTIVELLIAVTIIGVLAAIAIPNYQRYVSQANRVDATTELMRIAAEQEKYYLQNNTYATEALLAPFISGVSSAANLATQNDYYDIAITDNGGYQSGFIVTATAKNDGPQFNSDPTCRNFRIDDAGQRTSTSSTNADSTAECW